MRGPCVCMQHCCEPGLEPLLQRLLGAHRALALTCVLPRIQGSFTFNSVHGKQPGSTEPFNESQSWWSQPADEKSQYSSLCLPCPSHLHACAVSLTPEHDRLRTSHTTGVPRHQRQATRVSPRAKQDKQPGNYYSGFLVLSGNTAVESKRPTRCPRHLSSLQ